MSDIIISDFYPWVLLVAVIIVTFCLLIGLILVLNKRKQVFSKEFMETNFNEIHENAFKNSLPGLGFPDNGNGFYSKKLSYKAWFEFNNIQRCHGNFLEQLPITLTLLLVAGIFFPEVVTGIGCFYILGRILYTVFYIKNPNLRLPGALICNFSNLALFGISMYGCVAGLIRG